MKVFKNGHGKIIITEKEILIENFKVKLVKGETINTLKEFAISWGIDKLQKELNLIN